MAAPRTAGRTGRHHRTVGERDNAHQEVVGIDDPTYRAELRRQDQAMGQAFEAGRKAGASSSRFARRADPGEALRHGEHADYYDQGYSTGRDERAKRQRADTLGAVRDRASAPSHDLGGFFLGLVGWALFVNYARDGSAGVTAWLRAKFFNETSPSASSSAAPAPTAPSTSSSKLPAAPGGGSGKGAQR